MKELRSIGIQPDVLVCRTDRELSEDIKEKLALFCDVDVEAVIQNQSVCSIYQVPLLMESEGLDRIVMEKLNLPQRERSGEWSKMVDRILAIRQEVTIGIVGKYVALPDAYMSVTEALRHGGIAHDTNIKVKWIPAESLEKSDVDLDAVLGDVQGILIPGGFDRRGVEGKILAIRYAREKGIPFFGICLGMQCAVIEFARSVLGWKDANSTEFEPMSSHPVIDLMEDQLSIKEKGGTMRLGTYSCILEEDSLAFKAYQQKEISERHRHRWELNNDYRDELSQHGLKITGTSPSGHLVEIVELADHPWFVGVQFHPEFTSRPTKPQPLFRDFIGATVKMLK